MEILTKEYNESRIRATAANWKTGAMLFPDRSKIERELSPDGQDLKDWQEYLYQLDLHTKRWADHRMRQKERQIEEELTQKF